jgi:[FeFe] hydrogenase H-cluster maturation GTPase HydF
MDNTKTPRALSINIGIFGRVNAGKSTLFNYILDRAVAITSNIPGTTTDAVSKNMELAPLGAVTFTDTAGYDDNSALGAARAEKSANALDMADIIILVTDTIGAEYDEKILAEAKKRNTPVITVINTHLGKPAQTPKNALLFDNDPLKRDIFLTELKRHIVEVSPVDLLENNNFFNAHLPQGSTVILVTPIDAGAPKGRLIMPQAQTIRALLDADMTTVVVKESGLETAIKSLKNLPALVITDSQAIGVVSKLTPENVPLTTFSVMFAAQKADINALAEGAAVINSLQDGDKVLIAEACTHHASSDDIGRIKLPKWLQEYTGKKLNITVTTDFKNIKDYKLIIHCGACTLNRKAMCTRLNEAQAAGVPITNYGIAISLFNKSLERVLSFFPNALKTYLKSSK